MIATSLFGSAPWSPLPLTVEVTAQIGDGAVAVDAAGDVAEAVGGGRPGEAGPVVRRRCCRSGSRRPCTACRGSGRLERVGELPGRPLTSTHFCSPAVVWAAAFV